MLRADRRQQQLRRSSQSTKNSENAEDLRCEFKQHILLMGTQRASSGALSTSTSMTGSMCEKDKKRKKRLLPSSVRKPSCPKNGAIESCNSTFDVGDKNTKITFVISQLSPEELEISARSCHRYLKNPEPSQRDVFVKQIVERYLESKKGNVELALASVKKLIEFRQNAKIEDLVSAFDNYDNHDSDDRTKRLQKNLASKKFYVQGFDTKGRSTLYFIPRKVVDHDLDSAIYSIERAIASTRSLDNTINCVVDFSEFPLSNIPPMDIGKQFLGTLRVIYVGQIHRIFLVNVPVTFTILWNIFKPFVGKDTRDKITMIKDDNEDKEKEMLHLYDLQELPSWVVSGGKKNRSLDVDEYLFALSFDTAFDSHLLQ